MTRLWCAVYETDFDVFEMGMNLLLLFRRAFGISVLRERYCRSWFRWFRVRIWFWNWFWHRF